MRAPASGCAQNWHSAVLVSVANAPFNVAL